jgi:hypothetical protein
MVPIFPVEHLPPAVRGGRGWSIVLKGLEVSETLEFTNMNPRLIQNLYDAVGELKTRGMNFRTCNIWNESVRVQRLA